MSKFVVVVFDDPFGNDDELLLGKQRVGGHDREVFEVQKRPERIGVATVTPDLPWARPRWGLRRHTPGTPRRP